MYALGRTAGVYGAGGAVGMYGAGGTAGMYGAGGTAGMDGAGRPSGRPAGVYGAGRPVTAGMYETASASAAGCGLQGGTVLSGSTRHESSDEPGLQPRGKVRV